MDNEAQTPPPAQDRSRLGIGNTSAAAEADDGLGAFGKFKVMGHQHQGSSGGLVQLEKHGDDAFAGLAIQVAGGLVGKEDFRAVDESTREGDTLLLATGELCGIMVEAVAQAHASEEFHSEVLHLPSTSELFGDHHVLQSGERGDKLEILEDEADVITAHAGAFIFSKFSEVVSGEMYTALAGLIETGTKAEERRLAAAGGADDGAGGGGRKGKGDLLQYGERVAAAVKGFPELSGFQYG